MIPVNKYFDVIYGVNLELAHLVLDSAGINFVGRTSKNNGVVARVKVMPDIEPNPADTISVAGGGSVMESFLQKEPYYSGRDLFYLNPKIKLSDKQLLYCCMCLKANTYKFSYGRQANKTLSGLQIPSVDEIPEWVEAVCLPDIPQGEAAIDKTVILNPENWKWFSYSDLFYPPERGDINSTFIVNKKEIGTPLVSAATKSNGVIGHLEKHDGKLFDPHTITIANTGQGSVGYPTFQEEAFFATNNITVLFPKFKCTKYIGLFLCTLIKQDRYKYSFGRVLNNTRISNAKIRLPTNEIGNPDWQFMEDYIKSLPYSSNL